MGQFPHFCIPMYVVCGGEGIIHNTILKKAYGFKNQKANTRNRCFWTCTIFSVRTKVQNLKPPFYSGKFLKQEDG